MSRKSNRTFNSQKNNPTIISKSPNLPIRSNSEHPPKNSMEVRKIHIGPLPDPETLRRYDDLLPGTAERIITMAEKEQDHVHKTVSRAQIWTLVRKQIGQISGFLLGLLGLLEGFFLVVKGHDWAGASMSGISLSVLVGLFVKESIAKKSSPPSSK